MTEPGFFISIHNQNGTGIRNNICATCTPCHPPGEYLTKITVKPEKITEDVVPDFEKLFGLEGAGDGQGSTGIGTRLQLSTKGLTNLLLEAELSDREEVGAVHVFDIVQTDQESGERGRIRIAAVVVEGKGKTDFGEVVK
ncbi:hypothetical protein W97_06590 [Coniosporium apollinis CBS 100218]|uniref:Uncharacterized protein n=1 Tax=Coniosporium apollinis (strain CBS 100218) TaxID=1168221 RepID=R7YZK3_CONA1|nr:uncharacterized protein W97_06590 [Coniosporium apollinis CBS 100218]EON67337.1 hypothetical protein W97_06590 [Coniosporium apollinis CBS 100218]